MKALVLKVLLWLEDGCYLLGKLLFKLQAFVNNLFPDKPKELKPRIIGIPTDVRCKYVDYLNKRYEKRGRTFKVTKKMRKYVPGQVVDGFLGGQFPDFPIRGALLGSYSQYGGGGYFLMRMADKKIIQVFTVRPVLE